MGNSKEYISTGTGRNRLRRRVLPANCRTLDRRCSHITHAMTISHYFRLLYLMRTRPTCSHKPHPSHRVRAMLPRVGVGCRLWDWDLAAGYTPTRRPTYPRGRWTACKIRSTADCPKRVSCSRVSLVAIAALNSRFQMDVAKASQQMWRFAV